MGVCGNQTVLFSLKFVLLKEVGFSVSLVLFFARTLTQDMMMGMETIDLHVL